MHAPAANQSGKNVARQIACANGNLVQQFRRAKADARIHPGRIHAAPRVFGGTFEKLPDALLRIQHHDARFDRALVQQQGRQ